MRGKKGPKVARIGIHFDREGEDLIRMSIPAVGESFVPQNAAGFPSARERERALAVGVARVGQVPKGLRRAFGKLHALLLPTAPGIERARPGPSRPSS